MGKTLLAIVVVALVVAGIFFFMRQNKTGTVTYMNTPGPTVSQGSPQGQNAPVAGKTVTVNLSAQNNSGESGTAVLTDMGGKTKVTLTLSGFPKDVSQPSHIHTGSCANLGGVKYPLNSVMNGTAETTIDASLDDILNGLPLAVNVHKSAAEINTYYACGDITSASSSAPAPSSPSNTNPTPSPAPYIAPPAGGGYSY